MAKLPLEQDSRTLETARQEKYNLERHIMQLIITFEQVNKCRVTDIRFDDSLVFEPHSERQISVRAEI